MSQKYTGRASVKEGDIILKKGDKLTITRDDNGVFTLSFPNGEEKYVTVVSVSYD